MAEPNKVSPAFVMPDDLKGKSAEDLAQMYVQTRDEYGKFKSEWEPRNETWGKYNELGKPEEIDQVIKWGKTYAPLIDKVAKGELKVLNDADYKAFENWSKQSRNGQQPPQTDPNDDVFAPVQKRIEDALTERMGKMVDEKANTYGNQIRQIQKQMQDQLNLYGHVSKLQRQYPNLDFEKLLKQGADYAQMPPDQLLNALIQSEVKSAGMDEEINKRVEAKLAEQKTLDANGKVTALLDTRRLGHLGPSKDGKPNREQTYRDLVANLTDRFPGWEQHIPLR